MVRREGTPEQKTEHTDLNGEKHNRQPGRQHYEKEGEIAGVSNADEENVDPPPGNAGPADNRLDRDEMQVEALNERVEAALRQLSSHGARISVTAVAAQLGIPRSSRYRNAAARELIHQRITETHADAEKNMAAEVNRLGLLIDALAARVRNQEERLRQLERRPHSPPQ